MALALRRRGGVHLTAPSGSSATVAVACAPFFAPARAALLGVSTVVM